jgi:DNA-binding GntR family transcriptional regulator
MAEEALRSAPTAGVWDVNRNREFHLALYAPAMRPRLLHLIALQRQRIQRYLRLYFALPKFQQQTEREHAEILQACVERDVTRAVALLERHLLQTAEILTHYLEEQIQNRYNFPADKALMALQKEVAFSEAMSVPITNE